MNTILFTTAALMVFSKFLDCYTTSVRIKSISQEKNPIARFLMKKIGTQFAIWLIFAIIVFIVGISLWSLFHFTEGEKYKLIYSIMFSLISIMQFAVAYHNHYRKKNLITRFLLKIYR